MLHCAKHFQERNPAMSITAIIAEYNPFHNGHLYQIRQAKLLTGCDHVVAVMSGSFVQRGEPSVMDKFDRTYSALAGGLDAVFELPVHIATASAEGFASGAVSLLNSLGCIDYLCFGSECGNLKLLDFIAQLLVSQPDPFRNLLKTYLKNGLSFPAAREAALTDYINTSPAARRQFEELLPKDMSFSAFLSMPNNILAIEYLKALKKSGSAIKPVTVQRKGSGYHSLSVSSLCSASAIRSLLEKGVPSPAVQNAMPLDAFSVIQKNWQVTCPVFLQDFSPMLRYRLLNLTDSEELCSFSDVPKDLARRIFAQKNSYLDYASFVAGLKTRNQTESSIRRALLHILLNLQKDEYAPSAYQSRFARLLGMRKGSSVLSEIKKNSRLPVITKPADACSLLEQSYLNHPLLLAQAKKQFSDTIRSSELFRGAVCEKFHTEAYSEYRQSPVIFSADREI